MSRFSVLACVLMGAVVFDGVHAASTPQFEVTQVLLDTQPSPQMARADGRFGRSLALAGEWMAVGVPDDEVGGVLRAGAVYVYQLTADGLGWRFRQRLPNPWPVAGGEFGRKLAFDGTRLVAAGAPQADADTTRLAQVYAKTGESWIAQGELKVPSAAGAGGAGASDLALHGDRIAFASGAAHSVILFEVDGQAWKLAQSIPIDAIAAEGVALALSDDELLIGLPRERILFQLGMVHTYRRNGTSWQPHQNFSGDVIGGVDLVIGFGNDLALSDEHLLIGCSECTALGHGLRGAAFVYARDGSGKWVRQGNPLVDVQGSENAQFGTSVALSGTVAAVAGPRERFSGTSESGTVTVYPDIDDPSVKRSLSPTEPELLGQGSHYGEGLAVSEGRVAVGMPGFDAASSPGPGATLAGNALRDVGRIETFNASDPTRQFAALRLPDGRRADRFGAQIATDASVAVIGVPGAFVDGVEQQGAADVYERIGQQWRHRTRLSAPTTTAGGGFGTVIALQGNRIAVGAPEALDVSGIPTGVVFIYERDATGWHFVQTLRAQAAVPHANARFGSSLAFDPLTGHLFIGAPGEGSPATGRAYEMERRPQDWAALNQLQLADGRADDAFGASLIVDRDQLIIGVPGRDTPALQNTGALAAFVRTDANWQPLFVETPPNATADQSIGIVLANGSSDGPGGVYYAGAPSAPDAPHMVRLVTYDGLPASSQMGPFADTQVADRLGASMSGAGNGLVAAGSPGPSGTNAGGRVKLFLDEGFSVTFGSVQSSLPHQDAQFGLALGLGLDDFTGTTHLLVASSSAPSSEAGSGMVEALVWKQPSYDGYIFGNSFESSASVRASSQ